MSAIPVDVPGGTAIIAMSCIALGMAIPRLIARIRRELGLGHSVSPRLFLEALENLPQAVCIFDRNQRLVACNSRYAELHGLTERLNRPGTTLRQIFEHRVSLGKYPGSDPQKYIEERLASVNENKSYQGVIKQNDGRILQVARAPMKSGGWVATDEDVTDRYEAEQKRTAFTEQERYRSSVDEAIRLFREPVEGLLGSLGQNATELRSTASDLSASSSQISKRTESAVNSSQETSASVDVAADAADHLRHSIAEINTQLHAAEEAVGVALRDAEQMNAEIGGLADAAQKIELVVSIIQRIAKQTNLLALNATIEASRAGSAGKGFGVVASEVKALAVQTAAATEQIIDQVAGVQASASRAAESILRNTKRMQEINGRASAITTGIEHQKMAIEEIAGSMAGAAQETRAISEILVEVNGGTSETQKAAERVLSTSTSVEVASEELRRHVLSFLRQVAS